MDTQPNVMWNTSTLFSQSVVLDLAIVTLFTVMSSLHQANHNVITFLVLPTPLLVVICWFFCQLFRFTLLEILCLLVGLSILTVLVQLAHTHSWVYRSRGVWQPAGDWRSGFGHGGNVSTNTWIAKSMYPCTDPKACITSQNLTREVLAQLFSISWNLTRIW